jgi:hypothetical protein
MTRVTLLLILISMKVFSLEITFLGNQAVVGEPIKAEVNIQEKIYIPSKEKFVETNDELSESFFGEYLYIDKVKDGVAVVVPLKEMNAAQKYKIIDKKNNYQLLVNAQVVNKSVQKSKALIVLGQKYSENLEYVLKVLITLTIVVIAIFFFFRYRMKKRKENIIAKGFKEKHDEFIQLIESASSREDYEIVVFKAEKYKEVVHQQDSYFELKKELIRIQYKKEWEKEELALIERKFEVYKEETC